MKKLVWVTGSKLHGYELVVTPVNATANYQRLNHYRFATYREAQDLANAINAALDVAKRRARAKTSGSLYHLSGL